jgi:hypothetical protein
MSCIDLGATDMSLHYLTQLMYAGTMLNGPVRPRTIGDQARVRAAVRVRRGRA